MKSMRVQMKNVLTALTATVAAVLCTSSDAAPRPRFTVTDLGTLPGGYETMPTKVNNRAQVVGSTVTAIARFLLTILGTRQFGRPVP